MNIGDVFYCVEERVNVLRNKIYTSIEGETWFKYDKPLRSYYIITYTVLGILEKKLIGTWDEDGSEHLVNEICLQRCIPANNKVDLNTYDIDWFKQHMYPRFHNTRQAAEQELALKQAEAAEMDKR
jgi:hypothetical protein